MKSEQNIKKLLTKTLNILEELKALNIKTIDTKDRTSIADFIIVADGTSSRHVNSMANNLSKKLKKHILSVEGLPKADWALIDFGDIILNIFKPEIRQIYNLEKIWSSSAPQEKQKFGS